MTTPQLGQRVRLTTGSTRADMATHAGVLTEVRDYGSNGVKGIVRCDEGYYASGNLADMTIETPELLKLEALWDAFLANDAHTAADVQSRDGGESEAFRLRPESDAA